MNEVRYQPDAIYAVGPTIAARAKRAIDREEQTLKRAKKILDGRLRQSGAIFSSPQLVKDYLCLQLAECQHEVFCVLFLDSQHGLLAFDEMFRGTLAQTSVYPREVLKRALALNAGAVVLAHNHPSGVPEPSRADEHLTQSLKSALTLIDVRVLDHIVVGRTSTVSFAERGLI